MSGGDALVVLLPQEEGADPHWLRVANGAIVARGVETHWLAACGFSALRSDMTVMLVPPAALVTLHEGHYPDLPPRQGRAVARLAALGAAIAPVDQLFAATDQNDDPAQPYAVAVAARSDMQHWLLWAQHHGLDPDIMVPAQLLIPRPENGFHRASIGGVSLMRGADIAFTDDLALPELIGDAAVIDLPPETAEAFILSALAHPPLNMRQGDFAKRVRRSLDSRAVARMGLWAGLILLVGLSIILVGIVKRQIAIRQLDAQSLALARQVLPGASDLDEAEGEMDRQLAARGAGGYSFTAPVAGLLNAMRDVPGVSLTILSRDPDGMIRATLASAKADDINRVLLALQSAGFTITATPSQDPGGRMLADITVRS